MTQASLTHFDMNKITYKKALLKPSEATVKESIDPILVMLGTEYSIQSQVALSAIIGPDKLSNGSREWRLCLNSNVDFLVVFGRHQELLFAVEHDRSIHRTSDKKKAKDAIKNDLFQRVELPLVRMHRFSSMQYGF
jgi:hypothetical protein